MPSALSSEELQIQYNQLIYTAGKLIERWKSRQQEVIEAHNATIYEDTHLWQTFKTTVLYLRCQEAAYPVFKELIEIQLRHCNDGDFAITQTSFENTLKKHCTVWKNCTYTWQENIKAIIESAETWVKNHPLKDITILFKADNRQDLPLWKEFLNTDYCKKLEGLFSQMFLTENIPTKAFDILVNGGRVVFRLGFDKKNLEFHLNNEYENYLRSINLRWKVREEQESFSQDKASTKTQTARCWQISLSIINAFISILGIAAVALAISLLVLNPASTGLIAASGGIGFVTLISSIGFYSSTCHSRPPSPDNIPQAVPS